MGRYSVREATKIPFGGGLRSATDISLDHEETVYDEVAGESEITYTTQEFARAYVETVCGRGK